MSSPPRRSADIDNTHNRGSLPAKDGRDDLPPATQVQSTPPSDSSEPSSTGGAVIDMDTFYQIIDLDEDDTHDFSSGMTWAYFAQATNTFEDMDNALAAKDLSKLSSLGHFLKGSSAALGLFKVSASCERMQHYGQKRDEDTKSDLTEDDALGRISDLLSQVKTEYKEAEQVLRKWFKERGVVPEE